MLTFKKNYFYITLLLFIVEVLIALYVKDRFIRPYVGDFLVVILIYCFLRTFLFHIKPLYIALFTLAFSFAVEFAQYFQIIKILGLKGNKLAETIIGTGFSVHDLLAYTLGVLLVYFLDQSFVLKT